jgi:hypothetical protein
VLPPSTINISKIREYADVANPSITESINFSSFRVGITMETVGAKGMALACMGDILEVYAL